MSKDEPEPTYSAREIVTRIFPATAKELIPLPEPYYFEVIKEGSLLLKRDGEAYLELTPIRPAGNPSTLLCCDLCQLSAPRHAMLMFRSAVAGSQGRRVRYVSLCRDTTSCATRRGSEEHIVEALINRFR